MNSAVSTQLTLVWPSTRQQRRDLLRELVVGLVLGLVYGLVYGLGFGLVYGLVYGLVEWLVVGLGFGLVVGLVYGLGFGLGFGLNAGGWFVLLQKIAHRRLARAGKLPPNPYDFLEWGIKMKVFRRVGGGVRFRHDLIQQHLAKTSGEATPD